MAFNMSKPTQAAPAKAAPAPAPAQEEQAPVQAEAPANEVDLDSISMMDLAGLDMSEIQEVRSQAFPAGIFDWEVDSIETDKGKSADDLVQFKALVKLTCRGVYGLTMAGSANPDDLTGKHFTHRIIKNIENESDIYTFMGMVKAFIKDIGGNVNQAFQPMIESAPGLQFRAPVRLKPNSKDKDADPFPELITKKIQPAR